MAESTEIAGNRGRMLAEGCAAALTRHARVRISMRSLSQNAVAAALHYGRLIHTRGAVIHAIGRKEVERYRSFGIDLARWEGVQVVCALDGAILTTYRNRDFRGLRARSPRHGHRFNRRRGKVIGCSQTGKGAPLRVQDIQSAQGGCMTASLVFPKSDNSARVAALRARIR